MHYHWGLGIGHRYAHTTASTDSQFHSTSPKPYSKSHDIEDYRCHFDDEVNDFADDTHTLELDLEPELGDLSQSDSESVLGDHVDMYGWGPEMPEASTEYYEF